MTNTQDILFIVLSVAAVWITVFLCWALYELATLLRRSNHIVADVQEKITQIENAAVSLKEKLINPLSYLGLLTGGGKALFSMLKERKQKKSSKNQKRSKKSDLYDDDAEDGDA